MSAWQLMTEVPPQRCSGCGNAADFFDGAPCPVAWCSVCLTERSMLLVLALLGHRYHRAVDPRCAVCSWAQVR